MAKVTRITLDNSGLDRRRLQMREISGELDAPLESVGQDLRHAREKKGESLEQVSRVLKIRKDLLQSLEESNLESLPGRAYVIGFVRSYADYLGLDAEHCVDRLKAEIAGRGDAKETDVALSRPSEHKMSHGGLIFAGLLVLVLVYSAYYLFVSAGRMTSQPVVPVPDRLAAQAGLVEQPPPPAAPPPQTLPANPAPPAAATAPAPTAAALAQSLPAGQKYGAQNAGSRVTIRVHRPVVVTVKGGDRVFMNRHLNAGDTYLVPNLAGLGLSALDAGAVEIILDGMSVGFAGKDGENLDTLSLNPQDVAGRRANG
jgi:cytoskeleton protein RodZ